MALVNRATNEITVKLVYYGPGLCGKTTNLEKIYGNPKLDNKGKMISMSTETDRTLFFDFMPMELGEIGGKKIRVQLYTVPGQVFYDATRKLVLRGSDGVVFVADSQSNMRDSNIQSLENLYTNLKLNRLDPDKVALVLQYNKRDLPNVDSVEEMTGYLKPREGVPVVEAAAIDGIGVTQTMRAAVSGILHNLKNNVDISLAEDVVVEEDPEISEEPPPAVEAKPDVAEVIAPEPEPESEPESVHFVSPVEPEPFGLIEDSPFDETVPAAPSAPRSPLDAAVESSSGTPTALELMLARASELVTSLEGALEIARAHKAEIEKRLES